MDIEAYNKLMEELDFNKSFLWNPKWSLMKGVEKSVDYVSKLTNVKKLEEYNPPIHLNGFFTGFVKLEETEFYLDGIFIDANYMYIERGVVKYLQQTEKSQDNIYQNFSFFKDNFVLNKTYIGEEGTLFEVGLEAKFKMNDLSIIFSRTEDESNIRINSKTDRHAYLDLPEERLFYLSNKVFSNYENLYNFFEGFNVNVYSRMEPLARGVPFKEAIRIIK